VREPRSEAIEVESRRCRPALQGRLRQPTIARPAQAEAAHGLRDRPLDALPLPIEPPALLALLSLSRGCQRLVLGTRMHAQAKYGLIRQALDTFSRQTA
jgi:hypothetical protein